MLTRTSCVPRALSFAANSISTGILRRPRRRISCALLYSGWGDLHAQQKSDNSGSHGRVPLRQSRWADWHMPAALL